MIQLANTPAPPTKEELLGFLRDEAKTLVTEEVESDSSPERVQNLRQIRRALMYWKGVQYVSPFLGDSGFIDFASVGSPISGSGDKDGSGSYDYNQNVYRGLGRKFISVLGQRSPNVKAVADDPEDEQAVRQTRIADNAAAILRAKWQVDLMSMSLQYHLWNSGTTFGYTPYVKNGKKYGYSSEPKMEARDSVVGPATYHCMHCGQDTPEDQVNPQQPVCPGQLQNGQPCNAPLGPESYREAPTVSAPVIVGQVQYENGAVELEILNSMYVTIPFFTKDLDDTPWLQYDFDTHKGKLLATFPELRKMGNLDNSTADSSGGAAAQMARDSAASPLGIPTPHRSSRWNYKRVWLKPEMYECSKDDIKRKLMQDNFPDGMQIVMVQGHVVDLQNVKLTDVWTMCKPETSEYAMADGIGYDLLPIQDLVNDCGMNIPAETIERGLTVTFADPRVIDTEQWSAHQAKAAELIPAMASVGENLSDSFYRLESAQFSNQIEPWVTGIISQGMQNVGVVPEIFGGGVSNTARQAEINKNAALMQLGTTWLHTRKFWEATYYNGVKQLARWGSGTMRHGALSVDLSELQEEGYHFESDEAMPMTWAQQRDFIMWLMEKPPELLTAYGVNHPMNVERNQALLGMTGYYTPGMDDYEKTMEVIQKLAQAAPVQRPQPDGSMDTQPSIPADEFEDDHELVVKVVQAFCTSPAGRKLRESNPDGYANVIAFGLAHAKLAQAPPPPPPPPRLVFSGKLPIDNGQAASVMSDFGLAPPPPSPDQPLPPFPAPAGAPAPSGPPAPPPGAGPMLTGAPPPPPHNGMAPAPQPLAPIGNVAIQ